MADKAKPYHLARVEARADEEIRRARLAVAERARDEQELREFLDMLGLLPSRGRRRRGHHPSGLVKWSET